MKCNELCPVFSLVEHGHKNMSSYSIHRVLNTAIK